MSTLTWVSPEEARREAAAWLELMGAELECSTAARRREVDEALARHGTYAMSGEELEYASKVAWRNSTRCIGRLFWRGLVVRDLRHLEREDEVFEALVAHIEEAFNGGRVRPVTTLFAPAERGRGGWRIWNHQLVRYAGYRQSDGTVLGDPHSADFTARCLELGWRGGAGTRFDVLPLVIQRPGAAPRLFELPPRAVVEVPIRHPDLPWFEELGLRWYAVPIICDMALDAGGLVYTAAPFSGWYMATEIASRNFGDAARYDQLPVVAAKMGLDTRSPRSLWMDRAMVELNAAVLYSYRQAGITMVDHHTASEEFVKFVQLEGREGRSAFANRDWIVPPMTASACPTWSLRYENVEHKPNYYYQPPAWLGLGGAQEER